MVWCEFTGQGYLLVGAMVCAVAYMAMTIWNARDMPSRPSRPRS